MEQIKTRRTPLYATHQKLGAHLVEFGGWEMPLCYTSIIEEHQAVRAVAGIFDVSHMGEVSIRGAGALEFLNGVLTNDARKLRPGQGQYTLMCNPRGGVVDDLYLYQEEGGDFLLVVNACNRQKILDQAFHANPNRFVNKSPQPPTKPTAVWINPPNQKLAIQA